MLFEAIWIYTYGLKSSEHYSLSSLEKSENKHHLIELNTLKCVRDLNLNEFSLIYFKNNKKKTLK